MKADCLTFVVANSTLERCSHACGSDRVRTVGCRTSSFNRRLNRGGKRREARRQIIPRFVVTLNDGHVFPPTTSTGNARATPRNTSASPGYANGCPK